MLREKSSLAEILADARVWKLKDPAGRSTTASPVWPTGRSELDARLPGGGWPAGTLVEVLLETAGLGEVQLFLPALVECQRGAERCLGWSGLRRPMNPMRRLWHSGGSNFADCSS
jgi:hypothetical protein